jgi:hypothetical protein
LLSCFAVPLLSVMFCCSFVVMFCCSFAFCHVLLFLCGLSCFAVPLRSVMF